MNQEIYSKFKSPDIVIVIKVHAQGWFGHVRMDGEWTVRKLTGRQTRRRKREREKKGRLTLR
jgi:hypothetical protein